MYAASVHSKPGPGRDDDDGPYVVVLVDLDAGVRMMSNVVGCPPDDVAVGMRVRARVGTAVRRPPPPGVPARLTPMPFPDFTPTVPELVRTAAARFGDHTYLVADGERLTLRATSTRVRRRWPRGCSPRASARARGSGILIPNSVDFVVAALARGARRRGVRAGEHVLADARARMD